ncbi:hypothetical protein E5D57_003425 [Metarhizium anisopliae]|nr:hypothetical protein E5D57_003425 [Metarhizium anisopliae]
MPFDEPDCISSEEPERPSTFLASIRAWSKTAGKTRPGEIFFQVQAFPDARLDKWGNIKIKVNRVPIWVPIKNPKRERSYEAARELVIRNFREDTWTKASDGWDAMEPYVKDRIEYATV